MNFLRDTSLMFINVLNLVEHTFLSFINSQFVPFYPHDRFFLFRPLACFWCTAIFRCIIRLCCDFYPSVFCLLPISHMLRVITFSFCRVDSIICCARYFCILYFLSLSTFFFLFLLFLLLSSFFLFFYFFLPYSDFSFLISNIVHYIHDFLTMM
jgi:hypothetical protein